MTEVHTVDICHPNLTITYFDSVDAAARHAVTDDGIIRYGSMVSLNAEKIISLRKSPESPDNSRNIIYYPDGAAALFFVKHKYPRIPGVELWLRILERGQSIGAEICIFGASKGVSKKTEMILSRRFPNAKLTILDGFRDLTDYERAVLRKKPKIVFVAMGMPRQDMLISHLQRFSPKTLYLGIGGSLDILTGEKRRAPRFFLENNMEFAYRLFSEPSRIIRQRVLLYFILFYYLGLFKCKTSRDFRSGLR